MVRSIGFPHIYVMMAGKDRKASRKVGCLNLSSCSITSQSCFILVQPRRICGMLHTKGFLPLSGSLLLPQHLGVLWCFHLRTYLFFIIWRWKPAATAFFYCRLLILLFLSTFLLDMSPAFQKKTLFILLVFFRWSRFPILCWFS